MAVFRSLLIPLTAAVMNLLSAGAAFGIVTAVFQDGWGASLIGIDKTGPIEAFLPVLMFPILFGLSMDYEVFLVSRVYEEWHRRRNNRAAQRSTADRVSVPRRNAGSLTQSGRAQDPSRASASRREWGSDEHLPTANSFAGWPDRDANRAAGGWRERNADDYFPTTRSLERGGNRDADQPANWRRDRAREDRWQDRETERASSLRRDRYGEYPRNDDRRVRAAREDDFVTGRGERSEGPLMIFPPARTRW